MDAAEIPFPETRAYVRKVLDARREYRREYAASSASEQVSAALDPSDPQSPDFLQIGRKFSRTRAFLASLRSFAVPFTSLQGVR